MEQSTKNMRINEEEEKEVRILNLYYYYFCLLFNFSSVGFCVFGSGRHECGGGVG